MTIGQSPIVTTPMARNRSRSPRKVGAVQEASSAEKQLKSKQPCNDAQAKVAPIVAAKGVETGSGRHVAIVGGGAVGANTAFCIATAKTGHGRLTITDIAAQMLEGQVMDMEDTGMHCAAASPKEAGQADVIIITAGRGVRDGETRLDCLKANYGILSSIVGGMQPIKKSAVIIVVSNPCDVLAYFVWKFSGLPANQVIGSGTSLDTARLRVKIGGMTNTSLDTARLRVKIG